MYTLYYSPGTASLAVHWMLIELGAEFDTVAIDFETEDQKSAAFLAINPSGHVPALIVDGTPRAEVAALLMLLAERHPLAGLAPAPGDAARPGYLQWMVYLANTLQPAFRAWFYADEPAGAEHKAAAQRQAKQKIEAAWDRFDARLSDGRAYLLGDALTAPDFLLTMLARWSRNMPRPATDWPHLKAYIDRMRSRPSLREVHVRERLEDWIGG
jgi:glutathione S-transferase